HADQRAVIGVECAERIGERLRRVAIHGVAHLGTIDDHGGDRAIRLDANCHATSLAHPARAMRISAHGGGHAQRRAVPWRRMRSVGWSRRLWYTHGMYIAMNNFRVKQERSDDFERAWRERESYLDGMDGFEAFHLLKGPVDDDG